MIFIPIGIVLGKEGSQAEETIMYRQVMTEGMINRQHIFDLMKLIREAPDRGQLLCKRKTLMLTILEKGRRTTSTRQGCVREKVEGSWDNSDPRPKNAPEWQGNWGKLGCIFMAYSLLKFLSCWELVLSQLGCDQGLWPRGSREPVLQPPQAQGRSKAH